MQPECKPELSSESSAGNRCFSALSPAAASLLRRHLTHSMLHQGTVLWAPASFGAGVYFPISGLLSIGRVLTNGECVEVGSIGREACAGGVLNFSEIGFPTMGAVQVGGDFARIPNAEFLRSASES